MSEKYGGSCQDLVKALTPAQSPVPSDLLPAPPVIIHQSEETLRCSVLLTLLMRLILIKMIIKFNLLSF